MLLEACLIMMRIRYGELTFLKKEETEVLWNEMLLSSFCLFSVHYVLPLMFKGNLTLSLNCAP